MAAIQTKTAGLRRCERKKGSKLGEFVRNFSHYVRLAVSPEFRLRPLLSGLADHRRRRQVRRVAGVQTPAFVERFTASGGRAAGFPVSPEFRLRPLLSAVRGEQRTAGGVECRRSSDSGLC